MINISLKKTIELINSGEYVKYDKDKGFDPEKGNSIQSHWGLTTALTKKLFSTPQLCDVKIKLKEFNLIDDMLDNPQETPNPFEVLNGGDASIENMFDNELEEIDQVTQIY